MRFSGNNFNYFPQNQLTKLAYLVEFKRLLIECLHDPANVQQTSSKCFQNTGANAGRLLDRVNTVL